MSDTPLDTARAKLEAIHKMADAGSVWGEAHTRVEIRRLARTALALLDEHAAASARREGETHDFKCYRCDKPLIANQTMEMCPACYEAVDLEPPKRPSADARAKLEQAVREWQAAKRRDNRATYERGVLKTSMERDRESEAASYALGAAEEALLNVEIEDSDA